MVNCLFANSTLQNEGDGLIKIKIYVDMSQNRKFLRQNCLREQQKYINFALSY